MMNIGGVRILKENEVPTTRRGLLFALWYGQGITDFELWKEGPVYCILRGNKISATGIRRITARTVKEWANLVTRLPL